MRHNNIIDRLRGCSVLAVVCLHYMLYFKNAPALIRPVLDNGYYGVTAFFCTSGFLITTNLLKRYGQVAEVELYAFYVMRFGRIVPPLTLLCLVLSCLSTTALADFRFAPPLTLEDTLFSALTLRSNVYYQHGGAGMTVWAILWSLSIEEAFYLFYPLMAKAVRSTPWLVVILVEIVVYAPVYRLRAPTTLYDYFGCFDGIAFGALAALGAKRFGEAPGRPAAWAMMLAGAALAVATYAVADVHTRYVHAPTLVAAGTALVLFASQCRPFVAARPWRFDPLAYIGRLSYEMYLFHATLLALLQAVLPRLTDQPVLIFAAVLLVTVGASGLVRRFYAEPLNRWLRGRLLPAARLPAPLTAAGRWLLRLALAGALFVPLVRGVGRLPSVGQALVVAKQHLPLNWQPGITVRNPQGEEHFGDSTWYWIGPDAAIELTSYRPSASAVQRFSLTFDAGMGPSSVDPRRELVLRAADGTEQGFTFFTSGQVRFQVALQPGVNLYTLHVAYPTERTTSAADPRDLSVRIEHLSLAAPAAPVPP